MNRLKFIGSEFSPKAMASILFLVFIWGISWPIYKAAIPYTPPLIFAGLRTLIGGLIFAIFLIPAWKKMKWRENWSRYCISALINTVLFFSFQTIGLVYAPGGLFSVLVYLQPVLLGVFAWMWLGEKLSFIKIVGLILGFIGILVVSMDSISGNLSFWGVSLGIATAICWALGVVYIKKESDRVDPMWMVALQLIIGGIVLTVGGSFVESWSNIIWNAPVLIGIGYGAILGIPIAFAIYYTLVNAGEASKVAAFTFLVPLISVFTSAFILKEPITFTLLGGLVLIVASIYFVNVEMKGSQGSVVEERLSKPS